MHKKSELSELPDGRLIDMETGKIYGKNELTGPKNEPEDEKATTIGPSNNSRPQEKQIVSIGRPTGSAGLLERVQPHDDDAERAVLGAMLIDTTAAAVAAELLTKEHFYGNAHQVLFELFLRLLKGGSVIDEVTVISELKRDGLLERIGGQEVVFSLIEKCPSASSVEKYARIVHDTFARREDLRDAHELAYCCHNPDGSMDMRRAEIARRIMARASSYESEDRPLETMESEMSAESSGQVYCAPIPWPKLDEATNPLFPGTVTVLGGSPGSTKSFAALQLIRNLSDSNIPAAILQLEDSLPYHMRRVLAQVSGVAGVTNPRWLREHAEEKDSLLTQHRAYLDRLSQCLFCAPDKERPTPAFLIDWIHRRLDSGARVLVIDPITMMAKGARGYMDDDVFVYGAKTLIKRYKASLVLITHPRKQPPGSGPRPRLTMDDMAGGTSYTRFTHTTLLLVAHAEQSVKFKAKYGEDEHGIINRTMSVYKARNGCVSEGSSFGLFFNSKTLCLEERGWIVDE